MDGLTIASLNLRFGIDPTTEQPYDVTAAIDGLDADIVAVQEVWRPKSGPAAHRVAAEQLGYHVVELALPRAHNRTSPPLVQARDGMHGTWWGVAVLSRTPVVDHSELAFRPIAFDAAERRALVAAIELDDGNRLHVVTPHLTYRLWGSASHLRSLARQVRQLRDHHTVLLGDFNMWGPPVGLALAGWSRPVRGRTWPANRPHSQIDHILVSPSLAASHGTVLPSVGSDHRPVRAVIRPHRDPARETLHR